MTRSKILLSDLRKVCMHIWALEFTRSQVADLTLSKDKDTIGTLEQRRRKLEDKLAKKKEKLKSTKEKLKAAKAELLKTTLMLSEVEGKCTKLERDNQELRSELVEEESANVEAEEENQLLESDLEELKAHSKHQGRVMNKLRKKVLGLETRAEMLKPLVDIGASLRLRFLQQARQTIYNHRPTAADTKFIQDGNVAAHSGNGVADAALFKAGLVSADNVLAKVFRRLYRYKPSDYLNPDEITMLSKILDCDATVKAVRKVRDTTGPAALREEHDKV
jgi:hypothetical protein